LWALFVDASCPLLRSCTGNCRSLDDAFNLRVSGFTLARQLLIAPRLNLLKSSFRVWIPVGPVPVKKTPVAVAFARSPPRSCHNHRSAPRLASCRHQAGPGSLEFLAPTAKRWGSFQQFPRQPRAPSEPAIRGTSQVGATSKFRKTVIIKVLEITLNRAINNSSMCANENEHKPPTGGPINT